jgi:hypothetical protein
MASHEGGSGLIGVFAVRGHGIFLAKNIRIRRHAPRMRGIQ